MLCVITIVLWNSVRLILQHLAETEQKVKPCTLENSSSYFCHHQQTHHFHLQPFMRTSHDCGFWQWCDCFLKSVLDWWKGGFISKEVIYSHQGWGPNYQLTCIIFNFYFSCYQSTLVVSTDCFLNETGAPDSLLLLVQLTSQQFMLFVR